MIASLTYFGAGSLFFYLLMYFRDSNSSFAITSVRVYNRLVEVSEKVIVQTKKIGTAIVNSIVEEPLICFYNKNISLLPYCVNSFTQATQFDKPEWVYHVKFKKLKRVEPFDKPDKHLPFLSVELTNTVKKYSLSQWIEEMRVSSDINVPLRVLVLIWAIETNTDIHLFSNETWLLNVITIDGDEKVLNVLTEVEVSSS